MIAYVDETGDENKFCIGYLFSSNEQDLENSVNKTRNALKHLKISDKLKNKLLNELKEHSLTNKYENIIKKFILELTKKEFKLYFFYINLECFHRDLNQSERKKFYIKTLKYILKLKCDNKINVEKIVFDNFDTKEYQNRVKLIGEQFDISIEFKDSANTKGIQATDISIGRVRRSFNSEKIKKEIFKLLNKSEIIELNL
jgi:hypothetical protein